MVRKVPIYVVDAFIMKDAKNLFTGNPAAVCPLEYDDDIPDDQKQQIAMEMNLSETAFVSKYGWERSLGPNQFPDAPDSELVEKRTIRWFTPTVEVALCGHATVASAKVVKEIELENKGKKMISFESKFSGKLPTTLAQDGEMITLNFPANPSHSLSPTDSWVAKMLKAVLGDPNHAQDIQYSPGTKILLVRLNDEVGTEGLLKVSPKFQEMLDIDTGDKGPLLAVDVTVKSGSGSEVDFYSRFFAPWVGVNEDPVTGVAHTVLTPYWTKALGVNDRPLKARQLSSRGGDVECTLVGDRVKLSGRAKIVIQGELFL